ncbi:MAG: phage tail fiber protein, partial [Methylobacter sp.]
MKKLSACLVLGLALLVTSFTASATSLSDYAENKLVDVLFRGTAFSESSPANYYVALYTSACSDSA